ncbi:MAG TPA: hypothetical protein VFS00_32285 [Polyangiaceae bacterium]|nr:hypothetical protein [Polyangiaceae bacterium]
MSQARAGQGSEVRQVVLAASAVEGLLWGACLALALTAIPISATHSFPARQWSVGGEAVAAGIALGFGLLALRRVLGFLAPTHHMLLGARWALVGVGLRIFVGVPAFLFALIVAAAGFAA